MLQNLFKIYYGRKRCQQKENTGKDNECMIMKYMLVNIQIIHCLNNEIPMQNTENKTKYMYTEQLQLLKKMHAAKKMQC